jgi:hypothetical protein
MSSRYTTEDSQSSSEENICSKSQIAKIPVTEILDDVVKGRYELRDVHAAQGGDEEAEPKDPVENSPLQLLDNVLEEAMEQTKGTLSLKEPGQFYDGYASMENGVMDEEQMKSALNHAVTAIELSFASSFTSNDAKEACNSFVVASASMEIEMKIKKAQELAQDAQMEREKLAEAAAVSVAFADAEPSSDVQGAIPSPSTVIPPSQPTEASSAKERDIRDYGFNITDCSYDVSFLPSDDPNIYKPLEIVSYIGMTNNVPI